MHNNGRYISRKQIDSPEFIYRGKKIQFHHKKIIENATELSFDLIGDLIIGSRKIVDSPIISSIPKMLFVLEAP
jgi:hypothetical protein